MKELWIPVSKYAQVAGISRGKAYVNIMTGKVPQKDIKVETVQRQQYMIRLTGELLDRYKKMFNK